MSIFFAPTFESVRNGETTFDSFTITFSAAPYNFSDNDDGTVGISMNNFSKILQSGYPRLPVTTQLYEIPLNAVIQQIDIFHTDAEWLTQSFQVERACFPTNGTFISSQSAELKKGLFPSNPVEIAFNGSLGSHNYCAFRFYPMAYASENQSILLYHKISVCITYEYVQNRNSGQQTSLHTPISKRAQRLFDLDSFDYSPKRSQSLNASQQYPYVIITPEQFTSSLLFLQNWREITIGSPVKIVTLEWIQTNYNGKDTPEQIRHFLQDKYVEWEMEYVLLVGSIQTIPMRICYPNSEDHSYQTETPTDYYYADLTGEWDSDEDGYYGERGEDNVDFSAEVFVGRIPFDSPTQIQDYCQKVIMFEQNTESWKEKSLLLGAILNFENEDGSDSEKTDGATVMEVMKNDVFEPNEFLVTTMYEKEGKAASTYSCTMPLNRLNVQNVWGEGVGIVDWYAHGNPSFAERKYWNDNDGDGIPERFEFSHPLFVSSTDASLFPRDKPAIVFAASCSNANPDDQQNLGISLLNTGAVGFIGSTTVSWGSTGWMNKQDGGIQTINYLFMYYLQHYDYSCGQSLYETLFEYRTDYDFWGWKIFQNLYGYVLYGDPCLSLNTITRFSPPQIPDEINGPLNGNVSEELSFSSRTIDPDGQNVYYKWDWGDGNQSSWIGPYSSGETMDMSHSWKEPGEYTIRVKAADSIGVESNWSAVHSLQIMTSSVSILQVKGGLFTIKAIVENTGEYMVTSIPWQIDVQQNQELVSSTQGVIDSLPAQDQIMIKSERLNGFGKRSVTLYVDKETETIDFFFFGPFLFKLS